MIKYVNDLLTNCQQNYNIYLHRQERPFNMSKELVSTRVPIQVKNRYEKHQREEGFSSLAPWVTKVLNGYCDKKERGSNDSINTNEQESIDNDKQEEV